MESLVALSRDDRILCLFELLHCSAVQRWWVVLKGCLLSAGLYHICTQCQRGADGVQQHCQTLHSLTHERIHTQAIQAKCHCTPIVTHGAMPRACTCACARAHACACATICFLQIFRHSSMALLQTCLRLYRYADATKELQYRQSQESSHLFFTICWSVTVVLLHTIMIFQNTRLDMMGYAVFSVPVVVIIVVLVLNLMVRWFRPRMLHVLAVATLVHAA